MSHKEIRPQRPRQAQSENPDRGKPHPRVIVQIARIGQLPRPMVKAINAGFAPAGCFPILPQPAFGLDAILGRVQIGAVHVPDGGAQFQPAFPIGPPIDLLDKFLCRCSTMTCQHGFQHIFLGQNPVADIGRQSRDMGHIIVIALACIIAPCLGGKSVQTREGGGIRGFRHTMELTRATGLSSDSLSRIWAPRS